MVARRRFLPLIVLVVLGMLGLIVRLYQVQIVEHQVWAREAANLVRTARTIPYLRGKILDRDGIVFVQDEEAWAVRFVYREFRRRHPLGQVAHARSALEGRSVSLQETLPSLDEWALALVDSRPEQLEDFARGHAVELCGVLFPEVGPGNDQRRSRAGELRFYISGLLDVSRQNWNKIKKDLRKGKGVNWTWVQLVADAQDRSVKDLRAGVLRRGILALQRLEQLALQLEVQSLSGEIAITSQESLGFLVEGLEVKRRQIEDAIAKDLFEEAAGFSPGRLDPEILIQLFDMEFVTRELGWAPDRLRHWATSMRSIWLDNRRTFHVPRAEIKARLRPEHALSPEDALFSEFALLFQRRPRTRREARAQSNHWRAINEVAVFSELPDLFENTDLAGLVSTPPLPFLESGLRELRERRDWDSGLLEAFIPFEMAAEVARRHPPEAFIDWRGERLDPWRPPTSVVLAAERLALQLRPNQDAGATRRDSPPLRDDAEFLRDAAEFLPWLEHLWEARFQAELNGLLQLIEEGAREKGLVMPLLLTEERLDRARKKFDYFVRDRGTRPERIDESPADEVVNTLTRYVKEYAGFEVEARTRRLAMALDEDNLLVARELIGVVRESTLQEVIEQQPERSVFTKILKKMERSAEDERRMQTLVSKLLRVDEVHGTSGIEGLMDSALRGRNGFEEFEGLQQREERTRGSLAQRKEDGQDVVLTLSIDLQMAAQNAIEHPHLPDDETKRDEYWFDHPVGAIVLADVNGEILAAASSPKIGGEPSAARDGEGAYNYDRTLRMPRFQPMGSIFKPFVAAYALARCGLDPGHIYSCIPREGYGSAGWNRVACHKRYGHGELALDMAIEQSCNAYFAQVGELLQSKDRVRELAHLFGFDLPSGVRDAGRAGAFSESFRIKPLRASGRFTTRDLNYAGNGLTVIEATPVQVARAVAGLATGYLPRMRLVKSVAGQPVPALRERIDLPDWTLERVRKAMEGVITRGSAAGKNLDVETLGFRVAAKTGSADYRVMSAAYISELVLEGPNPEMRKHTWFVGFFPAERPTTVLVVYCHDIGVTSGHSSVHVASQFLNSPELQAYMKGAFK